MCVPSFKFMSIDIKSTRKKINLSGGGRLNKRKKGTKICSPGTVGSQIRKISLFFFFHI